MQRIENREDCASIQECKKVQLNISFTKQKYLLTVCGLRVRLKVVCTRKQLQAINAYITVHMKPYRHAHKT